MYDEDYLFGITFFDRSKPADFFKGCKLMPKSKEAQFALFKGILVPCNQSKLMPKCQYE